VKFRILGPIEVLVDGEPASLGGPKPRALLAVLLLERGRVVSTDRLVTTLWGDEPPRDALGALRAYVSRLRAALGPAADPDRLRFRAPGYQLTVGDDELDAVEFEQLVHSARERAAAGEHDRALELLDAALGLWRGEALAEFDPAELGMQAELTRLEDLRLVAEQDRAEALLQLGRSRDAVTALEPLLQRHPEREPLAVLQMRALYLSGRQSDALAVYRRLRRLLVDELGVEPAEPTQAVHRQLLDQDPALVPDDPGPATNLPRRGTSFVGRGDELPRVRELLGEAPLVTLTGVGGVGKTRLALEVAEAQRPGFADGVWVCELAALADGGPVSHAVAAALRVQQRQGLSIEQSVIEYLRPRALLLILDNCEHVLAGAARLADRIVTQCPDAVVLATSREALGVDGERVWRVPPLPASEASALFVERARAIQPDFQPDRQSQTAVAEICERVDGLPLAIELAAARMRAMSPAEVAQRLDDGRLLTRGPGTVQPRHQSLTAAIDWSYRLLAPPEQQLFTRLSVFAGGADLAAIHAVCADPGWADPDVLELVTALVDKSMVIALPSSGGTRYRVLETLRAFGRERLPEGGAFSRRHAEYFVTLAEHAAAGVQGPDERYWVDRILPDADNLRVAFERAVLDRDVDLAIRLATSLPEVLQHRIGYEAAEWAEQMLETTAPEHPKFVAAVGSAARGAWARGDFALALRLTARADGLVPARGTARSGYPADVAADVALYQGDVEAALKYYTDQAEIARGNDDPIRLVWTLYYVAICHAVARQPELGVPAAQECVQVAGTTHNASAQSMAHYALGLVLKKSDPARALELFDEAVQFGASVRNRWWQGIALMEAASTTAVHGDARVAARLFVDVLDHWDRIGDRTQQWLNLRYVVRLLVRLEAVEDAVVLHHCLAAAGKPSPLGRDQVWQLLDGPVGPRYLEAAARGARLSADQAVRFADGALRPASVNGHL